MPVDPRFMDRQGSGQVTVVLAPSGSGKTRMLLEVAARRACLFFTGSRLRLGNVAGAGSDDVNAVVSWLENLPGGSVDEILVECAVGALLLSRLYILRFLKQLMPTLSALDWAFFQVEYPAVSDVFQQLVRIILESVYVEAASAFCALFSAMVSHLAKETGWEGLCILDESQTLLRRLEGRFRSLDPSGGTRPVLNPLVSAIVRYYGSGGAMFVSGTGRSMTKVHESFLSGSMKPFDVKEIYSMGGFSHVEDMEAYMQKYIDVSCLDMGLIAATYRGRRRWLVTALEEYMVVVHDAGKHTGFFMELASRMASLPGSKLGVVRSLYDDAHDFWGSVLFEVAEAVLVNYYLGGQEYYVVLE